MFCLFPVVLSPRRRSLDPGIFTVASLSTCIAAADKQINPTVRGAVFYPLYVNLAVSVGRFNGLFFSLKQNFLLWFRWVGAKLIYWRCLCGFLSVLMLFDNQIDLLIFFTQLLCCRAFELFIQINWQLLWKLHKIFFLIHKIITRFYTPQIRVLCGRWKDYNCPHKVNYF